MVIFILKLPRGPTWKFGLWANQMCGGDVVSSGIPSALSTLAPNLCSFRDRRSHKNNSVTHPLGAA